MLLTDTERVVGTRTKDFDIGALNDPVESYLENSHCRPCDNV